MIEKQVKKMGWARGLCVVSGFAALGSVPHSGFGIGLERTVAWICGLPHIRETIPYARFLNRNIPESIALNIRH